MTDTPPEQQAPEPDPTEGLSGDPEEGDRVPPALREPADLSFESPDEPERELREARPRKPRRRAARAGTNPSAEDLPDVVEPREPPPDDEDGHARWLREQRPPHWG